MKEPRELDCDEFVELVTDYLDGTLDHVSQTRFLEHLRDCEGCDAYLRQFRTTIDMLGKLKQDPVGPAAELLTAFRERR